VTAFCEEVYEMIYVLANNTLNLCHGGFQEVSKVERLKSSLNG